MREDPHTPLIAKKVILAALCTKSLLSSFWNLISDFLFKMMNLLMIIPEIGCFTISRSKGLFRSKFLSEGIHTWRQNNPTEKLLKCVIRAF